MSTHSKRKFFLFSMLLILPFKSILAYTDLDSSKNQFYVKSIINQVNVGYQNLYAGKIIYDPGAFGGVTDASYSEYSQKIDELIAQFILYKQDPDIPVQFYFGLGIRFQHLSNKYSIEGRVDKKMPSDRKESYSVTRFPAIIVGIKFFFAWF